MTERGQVVEDTFDWYAQDDRGNVWYVGEDTTKYEDGKPVTNEGSWEAGVDGAKAGIIMPARPKVGVQYRQEYYAGHAEDMARVLSLDEQAEVPAGHFTRRAAHARVSTRSSPGCSSTSSTRRASAWCWRSASPGSPGTVEELHCHNEGACRRESRSPKR